MRQFIFFVVVALTIIAHIDSRLVDRGLQGDAGNTTNTSNTSNKTNGTYIFVEDKVAKSKLSGDDNATVNKFIEFKDGFPRYKSNFDKLDYKIYAPEESYYPDSIRIMGVPFYAVGAAIFAVGLLFFIFRYGLGLCGGKKSRNVQGVTRFTRHCTFVTCLIGLLLFVAGIITAIVGGVAFSKSVVETNDSLRSSGNSIVEMTSRYNKTASDVNEATKNVTRSEPGLNGTELMRLDILDIGLILNESNRNNAGANSLADDLEADRKFLLAWVWSFFVIGLVFSIIISIAILKKLGAVAQIIGSLFMILTALGFVATGFWFSGIFKMGDICQNNQNIIYSPLDTFRSNRTGLLYYFNCLSADSQKLLNKYNFQNSRFTNQSINIFKAYLEKEGAVEESKGIRNQKDVIKLYKDAKYKTNDNIVSWGRIVERMDTSLNDIEDLRNCYPVRDYSVQSESNFCLKGMPNEWVGFSGVLVVSIGFLFLAIGGIRLRAVLEKLKEEKESMIDVRTAGGYI